MSCGWLRQLGLEIAPQMHEAIGGDGWIFMRFREDECALNYGLRKEPETFGAPGRLRRVSRFGVGDVACDIRGVMTNVLVAGLADRRMCLIRFLDHRAEQTSKIGQLTAQHRRPQIDIAQNPFPRVVGVAIRSSCKKRVRASGKVSRGRECELFLARKVVKEAAFAHPRSITDVVDGGRPVTLGADRPQRRIEQLDLGVRSLWNRLLCPYHTN